LGEEKRRGGTAVSRIPFTSIPTAIALIRRREGGERRGRIGEKEKEKRGAFTYEQGGSSSLQFRGGVDF